jgi:hypothetical protein
MDTDTCISKFAIMVCGGSKIAHTDVSRIRVYTKVWMGCLFSTGVVVPEPNCRSKETVIPPKALDAGDVALFEIPANSSAY